MDLKSDVRRAVGVRATEHSFRQFPDGEGATRIGKHVSENSKLSWLQVDGLSIDGHRLRNQVDGDGTESQDRRALPGYTPFSRFRMLGVSTLSRYEGESIADGAEQIVPVERFR